MLNSRPSRREAVFTTRWNVSRRLILPIILLLFARSAAAAIAIDANISKDSSASSATITTAAFSTAAANELLLAFVATDYTSGANTTVTGVTGAGLTWALVVRT